VTKGQLGSAPSDASITVRAPAKVNLILRILNRRHDGYHNLWSIMHTVALEDEVIMRVTSSPSAITLTCDHEGLSVDGSNLVRKAARAVLGQAGRPVGLEIELRKRIPMGAGLGGGSSDAAATILGLNKLLNLKWSTTQMADVGQVLGSDVAFFFYAPSAIVSDRGDRVRSVTIEGERWVVLAKPSFGIETKWAYEELARTRRAACELSTDYVVMDQCDRVPWSQLVVTAENDFEVPVFARHPRLQEIKRTLLDLGAQAALLSGSGATVFGLFDVEATARRAGARLSQDRALKVFVVPTCSGPLETS
jgi:4-diphosphocytidyl-2-C-methyl-D-erythritol kinase